MDETLVGIERLAPWLAIALIAYMNWRLTVPASVKVLDTSIAITKNLEETYEKKLAANIELVKQQFVTLNMERDRERDLQLSRLKDEIHDLVRDKELNGSKIDVLEKRVIILEQDNLEKTTHNKQLMTQVTALLAQVEDLTKERDKLVERVNNLESRITALIGSPPPIAPAAAA